MAVNDRFETCVGLARHAFIIEPDTKFNPDGLFKIKLTVDLSEPAAQAFKTKVDAAALEAFKDEVPEYAREAWTHYLPYQWELDSNTGKASGRAIFEFKRNAKIKIPRTGEIMNLNVAVFDSKNRQAWPAPPIPDGSLVRLWAEFRPIKISASRKAGVRMDFSCVKVLRMMQSPSISPFSDEQIEDGWQRP